MKKISIPSFPPQDDKALFDTLQFIKTAPFAKHYWQVFKRLYKQTETAILANSPEHNQEHLLKIMGNLLYRIDQEKLDTGINSGFPSVATMRYMKRRAWRFLKQVVSISTTSYQSLATKILIANTGKTQIDHSAQWLSMHIMYLNSRHIKESSPSYGNYKMQLRRYHLHQQEEAFPEIWSESLQEVYRLLEQALPWEIYEFAIKVLQQNQIEINDLSPERLLTFFHSPSVWLQRLGAQVAYRNFTFQGLQAELYAGLWFYSSRSQLLKIEDITNKRPKQSKDWQHKFAKKLADLSVKALKRGNSSRRVLRAVEWLQKNAAQQLKKQEMLPIAPALFNSPFPALRNLGIEGAKNAQAKDVNEWILSIGAEKTMLRDEIYAKIVKPLIKKEAKNHVSGYNIDAYVLQPSFYLCDFGWRLSLNRKRQYEFYRIWNKLSHAGSSWRVKEQYFINTIQGDGGVKAFIKYYNYSSYSLNYYPDSALKLIYEKGLDKLQDYVTKHYRKLILESPFYHLNKLNILPEKVRHEIETTLLLNVKKTDYFVDYWQIRQAFQVAENNLEVRELLCLLLENTKLQLQSAQNILQQGFDYPKTIQQMMHVIANKLPSSTQAIFATALSNSPSIINQQVRLIPEAIWSKALKMLNIEHLLWLVNNAQNDEWAIMREALREELQIQQGKANFWRNVLQQILNDEQSNLNERLLEDEMFRELFLVQKDDSILDITDPLFEELLTNWAQKNATWFEMDSPQLYKVCIHKIPSLRDWALNYAYEQGLSTSFTLRLFESKLPPAMQTAQQYLDSIPNSSPQELEFALALSDSPNRQVRAYALGYLAKRKVNFEDYEGLLACLAEHADPAIQHFVATELQGQKQADFALRFDREILRSKQRARKAKEAIKARLDKTLETDSQTLLELVKFGGKKDREWAIAQLTHKALAGEEIEGFQLK